MVKRLTPEREVGGSKPRKQWLRPEIVDWDVKASKLKNKTNEIITDLCY